MSHRKKYPREVALAVAKELKAELAPHCERIEIAGSLRREKPYVGDIELVFVPRFTVEPDGLFETRRVSLADRLIESWLAGGRITKRMTDAAAPPRVSSWGPNNKHCVAVASGIPVDLFAEPAPREFWRTLVIRTGPKDFNIRLMASAAREGVSAHAYGEGFHRLITGERIFADSEAEVLRICGLPWMEPKGRQ